MRSARSWFNVEPFEPLVPGGDRRARTEAVVVLVDGWTSVGGAQWIDSAGSAPTRPISATRSSPFVDERYPTRRLAGLAREVVGRIRRARQRAGPAGSLPRVRGARTGCAVRGDSRARVPRRGTGAARAVRRLARRVLGRRSPGLESPGDALLVELGAAALAFGDGTLPFDPRDRRARTGRLGAVARARSGAARWPSAAKRCAALRGVWLDAGRRDEYFLDLGAVGLRRALLAAGLPGSDCASSSSTAATAA